MTRNKLLLGKFIRKTLLLRPETDTRLLEYADAHGMRQHAVVEQALIAFFDRQEASVRSTSSASLTMNRRATDPKPELQSVAP